ncbi:MAG: phosphoribosylaminoimidazolesuccinocarboxamide synthase [Candidatus Woykebacteria bacterium GWA1_44_8]|uniref:Phosphoribosylaminoimidazole-succinocarboxamide synthase n=1 Tax=Candidatus Woykebacteria bacterium GWA1_44_8 TaxID=1802591 RepID=A0A1G1W376_9BACT|nr:MAG: phosphoribosylaminoimidazolesuccinocarboxamide synthase [Candidatus Woykebacteria bacterium GWA1_44_8]
MDTAPFMAPFGLKPRSGKVRDNYDLGDRILMVATDRISTFDVVHPTGIPGKGAVLTKLSAFWFEQLGSVVRNHLIRLADGTTADELPFELPPELVGRTMIVRKAHRADVECVVRGYLSGSGWAEYQEAQSVCGIKLAAGLPESGKLPELIFTPATKAPDGQHDINISYKQMVGIVGPKTAITLRERSLVLYREAAAYAIERGIIIADTKFEFGWAKVDGQEELIVIDEILTPDSSRFWDAKEYTPGQPQRAMDKQVVRDWALSTGWDKRPPAPALPTDVVEMTVERYQEIFRRLTGSVAQVSS